MLTDNIMLMKCKRRNSEVSKAAPDSRWRAHKQTTWDAWAERSLGCKTKLKGKGPGPEPQPACCVELNSNILETWQTQEPNDTFRPRGGRQTVQPEEHLASLSNVHPTRTGRRELQTLQRIATFIVEDLRPYSVIEGFRVMLLTLEQRYNVPSRRYFTTS